MKEKIFIFIAFVLSLFVLLIFIEDDNIELDEYTIVSKMPDENKISSEKDTLTSIKYETTNKKIANKVSKEKKEKADPYIESKALTADGLYEVAIVNLAKTIRDTNDYVHVKGQIDGRTFNLNIPKYIIEDRTDNVTLQVTNTNTGLVQSTPANFLYDIKGSSTKRNFIDIHSNDIDNVSYEAKASVLPLPGVPQE